jgi:acetylornithine deacetylase
MTDLATAVGLLERLVSYPTVSSQSNLALIADLAERLEDLGARVEIHADETGTKANLFATLGPEGNGGIVLSGHSDVVPAEEPDWSSDPFTLRHAEDRLYGRGTCDMKGFIAACMAMAPAYAARDLTRPLHFCFTHDEEVGCLGARNLVEVLRARDLRPGIALIGEPTEMRIIEGHKGCCEYTTRFQGLEGHGSRPELGVSAVEYAARFIGRLLELRQALIERAPTDSRFEPPWSTLQVGRIEGGTAHNVIAGQCQVDWEMRPVADADLRFVKEAVAHHIERELLPAMQAVSPDAFIETLVVGEVVGLEPMEENAARELVAELTGANGADLVAFGTEAGLFQSLGTSAVICGPGSIAQAHKADEYVSLAQMEQCLEMLRRLEPKLAG